LVVALVPEWPAVEERCAFEPATFFKTCALGAVRCEVLA
jgi:hypothetical protein